MVAAPTTIPVEEYLRTTYDPDVEYVNGELGGASRGEYLHSLLQSAIIAVLCARARSRGFRVFTEQRVQINEEPRYRIPDICIKSLPTSELRYCSVQTSQSKSSRLTIGRRSY